MISSKRNSDSKPVPKTNFRDDTARPAPFDSRTEAAAREESHFRLYYTGLAHFLSGFGESPAPAHDGEKT